MDIAIIGLSGRFPDARNLDEFRENLKNGKESINHLSVQRIRNTSIAMDNYRLGGYLEDIDLFDYKLFALSKSEAEYMDPTQRILLEVVYEAIEHAGYNHDELKGSDIGVYVGDTSLKYYQHCDNEHPTMLTGNLNGATSGRISRYFDLRGTSMMIDTSCSSSLVAVSVAVNDIATGLVEGALVCGARLLLFPGVYNGQQLVPGISALDGRTRAFDAAANGTGTGEGIGCVLLKPLEKAVSDNDIIYAVIKGTATNQDAARSGSLTAPSSIAQSEVLKKAWKISNINPVDIGYIEAHGTGTKLGDPIEMEGINQAFMGLDFKKNFCALSSVKTNIGHTDTAAGISSLIKVVLSLYNKELYPSLNYQTPNPFIDFINSPIYVNTKFKKWETPNKSSKLTAGVSSFGLSGTNCHVILEEFSPLNSQPNTASDHGYLVPISGNSVWSLKQNIAALRAFINQHKPNIADISYTASIGRKHYKFRHCVFAENLEELILVLNDTSSLKEVPRDNKAIFILSDHIKVSDSLLNEFIGNYSVFREICEQFRSLDKLAMTYDGVRTVFFQYAYYQLLKSVGVKSKSFIGLGLGLLVVEVIQGKKSLVELLNNAKGWTAERAESINSVQDRCKKLLDSMKESSITLIDMGPKGVLTKVFEEIQTNQVTVVSINEKISHDKMLDFVRQLFLTGFSIDWKSFVANGAGKRIKLPTYQFDRERCWAKPPMTSEVPSSFYQARWEVQQSGLSQETLENKNLIVVSDAMGLSSSLIDNFQSKGARCIKVDLLSQFKKYSSRYYTLNKLDSSHYEKFYHEVIDEFGAIDGIIDLTNFRGFRDVTSQFAEKQIQDTIYPQLFITKAFHEALSSGNLMYAVIETNGHKVTDLDQSIDPYHAASFTFAKSLNSDYVQMRAIAIDVKPEEPKENIVNALYNEFTSDNAIRFIALRNGQRYIQVVSKKSVETNAGSTIELSSKACYVITGGAKGIGFEIAKHLATKESVSLIILGRSERQSVQHALATLEQTGREIIYHSVDVGNLEEVTQVVDKIKKSTDGIDGIIHAAGVFLKGRNLASGKLADFVQTISPKVFGTINLSDSFESLSPRFFVNFSSVNAIFPQKHSIDYAVANAFQSAFSVFKEKKDCHYLSIEWGGWKEVGMAVADNPSLGIGEMVAIRPMRIIEVIEAIEIALNLSTPSVISAFLNTAIARGEPYFRIESDKAIQVKATDKSNEEVTEKHANTDVTSLLISLWKEALNVDSIDIDDDFYDLGGHSLIFVRVINRIESILGVSIELYDLFDYPTIRELSNYVISISNKQEATPMKEEEIVPVEVAEYYELSPSQKRLWVANLFAGDKAVYNVFASFAFDDLNIEILQRSFDTLIERHESLRTTFTNINGEPYQIIHQPNDLGFKIEYEDLSRVSESTLIAGKKANEVVNSLFDLEEGPLIRVNVYKVNQQEFILTLTMHHLVSDGWSLDVLINEVKMLYKALLSGQMKILEPLKFQFKDYSGWQNRRLREGVLMKRHKEYWLDQFTGIVPVLNLEADFIRPRVKTYNGRKVIHVLDQESSSAFKKLVRDQGLTSFTGVVSLVKVLLFRYTSQMDITIGTVMNGRERLDFEQQIGFYVNYLALRTKFEAAISFYDLMKKVNEVITKAYEHQSYPFDLLIDDLKIQRDPSRTPLFDIVVTFQNLTAPIDSTTEHKIGAEEGFKVQSSNSMEDLNLAFADSSGGGLTLSLTYNTDLFEDRRIRGLIAHVENLMKSVAQVPDLSINQLELISKEEKSELQILGKGNSITPRADSIIEMFKRQVTENPKGLAISYQDEKLSYHELDVSSTNLANVLIQYGVLPDDLVGVVVKRSHLFIVSILAILKCGAAYVPIDYNLPVNRKKFIYEDSCFTFSIVEDGKVASDLGLPQGRYIEIGKVNFNVESNAQLPVISGQRLAYVMYTSGSTGQPKGVVVRNDSVANYLSHIVDEHGFNSKDCSLLFTSVSFDASVLVLWGMLTSGGAIRVVPDAVHFDLELIVDELRKGLISILFCTTTQFKLLLQDDLFINTVDHKTIRLLILGGEKVDIQDIKTFLTLNEFCRIENEYGPTESTVAIMSNRFTNSNITEFESDPHLLKPISNAYIYLLDENCNPVPKGFTGEISVAGIPVSNGYLNSPDSTIEKFVEIGPSNNKQRIYRTGDYGKWLDNGYLRFLGRRDEQIKLGGSRVELGEIERAIVKYANTFEVKVLVHSTSGDNKFLVAFYRAEHEIEMNQLRREMKKDLPDYMLPNYFIRVSEFPYNNNGKIDQKALLALVAEPIEQSYYVEPSNQIELEVQDVWKEVLERQRIGVTDNFFTLGGQSLTGIRIITRINRRLGVELELRDLFYHSNITELSAVIFQKLKKIDSFEL
jgi:amino acid adenylation domain-containing protein